MDFSKEYTVEQLNYVVKALAKLRETDSRRISCNIPTEIALDWGCNHGGVIDGVSNQDGVYGWRGFSIHYSWGNDHAPGSTSGHNMCFYCYGDKVDSDSHFTKDTPENQVLLRNTYIPLMAMLYETTPDELIKIGVNESLKEERFKIYKDYLKYLKGWANSHNEMGDYGMSPACFDEWYDNECQYEEEE